MIIRSSVPTSLIRRKARMVENSAGWFLRTTYNLEVKWAGFRGDLDSETNRCWAKGEMQLRTDPNVFFGSLVGLVTDAATDQAWFADQTRSASRRPTANIDRVVNI